MGRRYRALAACTILLPAVALGVGALTSERATWLDLIDAGTGRRIAARLLSDGDTIVLTWTNSLFRLPVTEVFVAGGGHLTLTTITFADPAGAKPPHVRPEDVDDLYQTGGPFTADGLSRRFDRVVFRVGEIGDPTLRFGTATVQFVREVGFGGAVIMTARQPTFGERVTRWLPWH